MKTRIALSLLLAVIVVHALTIDTYADSPWSAPKPLAGNPKPRQSFVDFNGNLFLNSTSLEQSGETAGRTLRQILTSTQTVSTAVLNPNFISNANPNQRGDAQGVYHDVNGDRIVTWFINNNSSVVMAWQSASGTFGPNVVSLNGEPAGIAFRNGRVFVLFTNPNGTAVIREWSVDGTGALNATAVNVILIDSEFSACGGGVAIDADGSGTAVFRAGLEIRSATRSASGTWSLDSAVIDAVTLNVETIGCAYAKSSPGGRLVVGWWKQAAGDTSTVDRGGTVRAFVREPGSSAPPSIVTLLSANQDLTSGNKRRDVGLSVAVGLDGTAGVLAYTHFCGSAGTVRSSTGVLRVAASNQSFTAAPSFAIGAMESSANRIFTTVTSRTPAHAFAVENNRAILGTHAVAFPGIGTDLRPACGAGQQVFDAQVVTAHVTMFEGRTGAIASQEVGSKISQVGNPQNVGANTYRPLVDAAIDAAGHVALVRADVGSLGDVILSGEWASGSSTNLSTPTPTAGPTLTATPQMTVTPEATPTPPDAGTLPTPTPTDSTTVLRQSIQQQVNEALLLLTVARQNLPSGSSKKATARRGLITKARRDLSAAISVLLKQFTADSTSISTIFVSFTGGNLRAIQSSIRTGSSAAATAKKRTAAWKAARSLLEKLVG